MASAQDAEDVKSNKRNHSEFAEQNDSGMRLPNDLEAHSLHNLVSSYSHEKDDSSSDDDMGPQLPSAAPKKKRRVLPYEKVYIAALPKSTRYSKSLMHKEQLSTVTVAPSPADFVITASIDGAVKFWKNTSVGIEFAKEYKAHEGLIQATAVSADGSLYAT